MRSLLRCLLFSKRKNPPSTLLKHKKEKMGIVGCFCRLAVLLLLNVCQSFRFIDISFALCALFW